jgi:hypothetical protein
MLSPMKATQARLNKIIQPYMLDSTSYRASDEMEIYLWSVDKDLEENGSGLLGDIHLKISWR